MEVGAVDELRLLETRATTFETVGPGSQGRRTGLDSAGVLHLLSIQPAW